MSNEYLVYVHTCRANNKKYVGRTQQAPAKRWQNGYGYIKTPEFFKDIKLYGWGEFDHVIYKSNLSEVDANMLEETLINELNTTNPDCGYNLRHGGFSNFPTESVSKNISISKMGHEVSIETRKKLKDNVPSRKVIQYNCSYLPIATYDSLTQAAAAVGSFKSNIYAVCNYKKRTCKGFIWRYADDLCIRRNASSEEPVMYIQGLSNVPMTVSDFFDKHREKYGTF